jgi:hypothetical protein
MQAAMSRKVADIFKLDGVPLPLFLELGLP